MRLAMAASPLMADPRTGLLEGTLVPIVSCYWDVDPDSVDEDEFDDRELFFLHERSNTIGSDGSVRTE